MDSMLLSELLTMIIASLDDKVFLSSTKRILNKMSSDDPDTQAVSGIVSSIIQNGITTKEEALSEIESSELSLNVKCKIEFEKSYKTKYKQDFLKRISQEIVISQADPIVQRITDNLLRLRTSKTDKNISKIHDEINRDATELHKRMTEIKISAGGSNSFIIDPNDRALTEQSVGSIVKAKILLAGNKVKTFKALDVVTNGGLVPETISLVAAKPGGFKSGVVQNAIIHASKNNEPDKFALPEGKKPAMFFVSMELTRRQMYDRHIAWFYDNSSVQRRETSSMTEDEMLHLIFELSVKAGIKIPVVYIQRLNCITTMSDIKADIAEYENLGFHPVLIAIDYLTKLTPDDITYRSYRDTSQEGARKQQKKSEEIRAYAVEKSVPIIIPEQISTDAIKVVDEMAIHAKKVDPLYFTRQDMLNGARLLSSEYENIIFIYKSEIEEAQQSADIIIKREFISLISLKTRDEKLDYVLSDRDKINATLYDIYTNRLKKGLLRDLIVSTGALHVVSPLVNYRILDDDYAKSIRMYYVSDNSEYVSLEDLKSGNMSQPSTSISDMMSDDVTSDELLVSLGLV
ncbi:MAG: DnaB family ATPase [Peptostreptococcaceae bacterium]